MTREEILQETNPAKIWRWIRTHPDEADAEVATHFNKLARADYLFPPSGWRNLGSFAARPSKIAPIYMGI